MKDRSFMGDKGGQILRLLLLLVQLQVLLMCGSPDSAEKSTTPREYERIARYLKDRMESTNTPSISIGLARGGEVVWEESFGFSHREKQIKATPQTIYSLASISKTITATAMMILVERDLVDLNAPVNSYMVGSQLKNPTGSTTEATLDQLLHHTAGLPAIWSFYFDGAEQSRPEMLESIARFGVLAFPPGSAYIYSNLGYGIAGQIVESVSGKSFPQFLKSEVFMPLGMKHSFVITDKAQYDAIAPRYLENKNPAPYYDLMSHGGGGICASVDDLLHFGMFHLKDHLAGQQAILKDSTIDLMQTRPAPKLPETSYRLGWETYVVSGHQVVGHGGGMPGVSSALFLVPSADLALAILSNGSYIDLYQAGLRLIALLLPESKEELTEPVPNRKPEEPFPPQSYLGYWIGEIWTETKKIPLSMDIKETGKVLLTLTETGSIYEPLETFRLNQGVLAGSFDFEIPTVEASTCRHKTFIRLVLKDDQLTGVAAAISYRMEVFRLPYYLSLKKQADGVGS